ncbi:MAG: hypothetical protein GQ546_00170 [Gammaproteobacteria bacterium]|nr:hypothetical protein [Gammaproteobacteria bacterium]
MFDKEVANEFFKYLIFWFVCCCIVGCILIIFNIDLSDLMLANYLKDTVPAMKLLEQTTKYPQLAVSIGSVCWITGSIYMSVIVYKFSFSLIDHISSNMIILTILLLWGLIWYLYFGAGSPTLPGEHSGKLTRIVQLTQPGIIFNAALMWMLLMFSVTSLIGIIIYLMRKIFYGK